jgi:hypothetical protein
MPLVRSTVLKRSLGAARPRWGEADTFPDFDRVTAAKER